MPYEIPQKLQYEEKIIFNLTFKQMLYLVIFGLPALIIFLKTNLNIVAKGIIGAFLVLLLILLGLLSAKKLKKNRSIKSFLSKF